MSREYDENGRPCPKCGNAGDFNSEHPIYNAARHYGELFEFTGFGSVNDIGWWCSFCTYEYGFEFSEASNRGEPVTMKPYRVVLEIPRDMLTALVKLCGGPANVGILINALVNVACEGANDETSWQALWLRSAGIKSYAASLAGARGPQPVDQGKVDITPEV